ncbi:MAG: universal stress protein [Planctomycetota bacterium JB042]
MNDIRTIVAATDLSPSGAEVLRTAKGLADRFGARVEVVHVVFDLRKLMGFFVSDRPLGEMQASLEQEATSGLRKQVRDVFGDAEVGATTRKGTPYGDLVRHVEEVGGDLLVVGAHGAEKPEHRVYGSTVERLVKESPCPVLVIGQDGAR